MCAACHPGCLCAPEDISIHHGLQSWCIATYIRHEVHMQDCGWMFRGGKGDRMMMMHHQNACCIVQIMCVSSGACTPYLSSADGFHRLLCGMYDHMMLLLHELCRSGSLAQQCSWLHVVCVGSTLSFCMARVVCCTERCAHIATGGRWPPVPNNNNNQVPRRVVVWWQCSWAEGRRGACRVPLRRMVCCAVSNISSRRCRALLV